MFPQIFNIKSDFEFTKIALEIFKFQFENNKVYRSFCDLLCKHPSTVKTVDEIPFLPIQFFKSHQIVSNVDEIEQVFTSSGTTQQNLSKHYITDIEVYKQSFSKGFEAFYSSISDYTILALLPNYLEREGSSLVYMVADFIKKSTSIDSGFYLHNLDELAQKLTKLDSKGTKILLIGVSFALLDLIEKHQFNLQNTIVMETGGMKGKRKEITREELHLQLKKGFGISQIHSEYGMTELLSQAYSKENGFFKTPSWMKVLARDTEDALTILPHQKVGGINIIDLANYNSCSFIATQDLGKTYSDGSFEVLGRFDNTDIRGCNLMYT